MHFHWSNLFVSTLAARADENEKPYCYRCAQALEIHGSIHVFPNSKIPSFKYPSIQRIYIDGQQREKKQNKNDDNNINKMVKLVILIIINNNQLRFL